jgi:hypothetical protein
VALIKIINRLIDRKGPQPQPLFEILNLVFSDTAKSTVLLVKPTGIALE